MARSALATVDKHHELILTASGHQIPWLKEQQSVDCVVEVVQKGLVYVSPLKDWAASEGIPPEEAEERLRAAEADPDDEVDTQRFLRRAKRKGRRGAPIHEIRLPDMALFVLFEQGEGPLAIRRGGGADSAAVIVVIRRTYIELRSQSLF